jgi:hypothetical protein
VKWLLWDPTVNDRFPSVFQHVAYNFITAGYRQSTVVAALPQELVLFILNFCDWNHFGTDPEVEPEPEPEPEESTAGGPGAAFRQFLARIAPQLGGQIAFEDNPDLFRYMAMHGALRVFFIIFLWFALSQSIACYCIHSCCIPLLLWMKASNIRGIE